MCQRSSFKLRCSNSKVFELFASKDIIHNPFDKRNEQTAIDKETNKTNGVKPVTFRYRLGPFIRQITNKRKTTDSNFFQANHVAGRMGGGGVKM